MFSQNRYLLDLGEKPPLEDAKPFKIRKVPICKCGESNATCTTCGEGYLEVTMKGQAPTFKEVKIEIKKVPVCECGEEKEECSTCNLGYLQAAKAGLVPKFKEVELDHTKVHEGKDKEARETKESKETSTGLIKLLGFGP